MEPTFTLPVSFTDDVDEAQRGVLLPRRGSAHAAGLDLVAHLDKALTLQPMERALVPTGVRVAIPAGWEGQVRPRSGLAFKHGITVLNGPGTIDADYRGEVKVLLIHLGSEPFTLEAGTRLAQLVLTPTHVGDVEVVDTLPDTDRGSGGFGSTGVHFNGV